MELGGKKMKRKEWRKYCKKRRRKLIRQKAAKERVQLEDAKQKELEANPEYQKILQEKAHQEEVAAGWEELERALRNAQWLEEEHRAQQRFAKERQQMEAKEREDLEKRERIRMEFEERERKIEEARTKRRLQQEEMQRMIRERQMKLQEFAATGIDDYLAELQTVHSSRLDAEDCKFFVKTGACRHGLRCSGNHPTPGLSKLLLIPNFFNHPALERTRHKEYGNDATLEFDEDDLRNSFAEFFRDIIDEFEQLGNVHHIFVCRNVGLHLRGNVFIEYKCIRNAAAAYLRMNGRFYAKKQLNVEFRNPIVWPAAVCGNANVINRENFGLELAGLFELKRCQKGPGCNFLHIFKNPDHRYAYDHFQECRSVRKEASSVMPATPLVKKSWDEITSSNAQPSRNAANWRWSESPEAEERSTSGRPIIERREDVKPRNGKEVKRERSRSHSRRSSRSKGKHDRRNRSRSPEKSQSRRQSRSRSRGRDASSSRSRNRGRSDRQRRSSSRGRSHRQNRSRSRDRRDIQSRSRKTCDSQSPSCRRRRSDLRSRSRSRSISYRDSRRKQSETPKERERDKKDKKHKAKRKHRSQSRSGSRTAHNSSDGAASTRRSP